MWFPFWSDENGQDDLVWYEAERIDEWTWYAAVDLNAHYSTGTYNIHFYQGNGEIEDAQYISAKTYDIDIR